MSSEQPWSMSVEPSPSLDYFQYQYIFWVRRMPIIPGITLLPGESQWQNRDNSKPRDSVYFAQESGNE